MERFFSAVAFMGIGALGLSFMATSFADALAGDIKGAIMAKVDEEVVMPGQIHAKKTGLPYHAGYMDYAPTLLAKGLLNAAPDLSNIKMVEGARQFSSQGIALSETYTTLLYVHGDKLGKRYWTYANQCSVTPGAITGEIVYKRPDAKEPGFKASGANYGEVLTMLSQRNCEILAENGTFDALKAKATAAQARR